MGLDGGDGDGPQSNTSCRFKNGREVNIDIFIDTIGYTIVKLLTIMAMLAAPFLVFFYFINLSMDAFT